ncbi:MAG: hypothetical protein EON60_01310 [Alphaproteobacteria bacterium]|nr:MAG: hypothetical protein EON60_01310 [Alphaproteobacteria bacterium]
MDIRALNQLSVGLETPAAAVAVPADSRALLSEIAASAAMSEVEKGGLIAAVATVDSGLSGQSRESALATVQRLGIYLKNSASEGFPKWPMMTALRAYGMNLSEGAGATETSVRANLRGQLEQIAQGRGVSLERAIAAASVPMKAMEVTVEAANDGVGVAPAPSKVETLA